MVAVGAFLEVDVPQQLRYIIRKIITLPFCNGLQIRIP
jgi:hypothetical protein